VLVVIAYHIILLHYVVNKIGGFTNRRIIEATHPLFLNTSSVRGVHTTGVTCNILIITLRLEIKRDLRLGARVLEGKDSVERYIVNDHVCCGECTTTHEHYEQVLFPL